MSKSPHAVKTRIFLADDHAFLREGLRDLINRQPDMEVVGEADNGRLAYRQIKTLKPDVVVMDVSMPDIKGTDATLLIKREFPEVKVLALTAHEDTGYLRQMLQAGASGYVVKRVASDDLIQAIRIVAAGGVYIDPTQAGKIVKGYIYKSTPKGATDGSELSERERDVLRRMAWGYSNKEIAQQLGISVKTVETYKTRMMEKLELKNRVDIVRYAVRQGWMEEEE